MVELTDAEAKRIIVAVEKVQVKHMDGSDITGEKLGRFANELEGRLNDLGFAVTVDVTPLWSGQPPTVRIDRRIDGPDSLGTEHKMYDVRKRVERNEDVPEIEGHV
jgi:hypothetical protein